MLSREQLKQARDIDPWLMGWKDIRDACKYSVVDIPAGVMAREIEFFSTPAAPGVGNLEKANEITFPLTITAIGMQLFGVGVDVRIVAGNCGMIIIKDNKEYESFSLTIVPGGGGLTFDYTPGVGAAVDFATNGLGTTFLMFDTPIKMDINQSIRGLLRTGGATIGAIVSAGMIWRGIEEHPVI